MKLLFHIGLNKAGSTYLQDYFSFNSQMLSNAAVFYPTPMISSGIGGGQSGNAAQFALSLRSGETEKAKRFLRNVVEQAISNNMTSILLSTEFMYHILIKKSVINEFKLICDEVGIDDIHLLVIFRDPISHSISAYNHRVGILSLPSFKEWLGEGYEFYKEIRLFLNNLVQEKNFRIFAAPYSTTDLADTAKEFLQIASLEKPTKSFANVSLNCVEAEIVRLLSKADRGIAVRARSSLKEIDRQNKAPDLYLRKQMEEYAFSYTKLYKPEISELMALIGSNNLLQISNSENEMQLFDDLGAPYFVLSKEQILTLMNVASWENEMAYIFRLILYKIIAASRWLPVPVKQSIKHILEKLHCPQKWYQLQI